MNKVFIREDQAQITNQEHLCRQCEHSIESETAICKTCILKAQFMFSRMAQGYYPSNPKYF